MEMVEQHMNRCRYMAHKSKDQQLVVHSNQSIERWLVRSR